MNWQEKLTEIADWLEVFFQRSTATSLIALSLIAGGMTGLVFAYQLSYSTFADDVDGLADYRPAEVTKVYADDGKTVIGELSLERRIPIEFKQIPETLKEAILAIEDTRFYEHIGVDPIRIGGSAIQNFLRNRRAQGASTLTQQLARDLFLSREKTYTRKIKEAIYALLIERVYTKDQILTLYCNQIFLGGGAYGFEAAANYYFSKHINELTLDQYALLAALPKGPQQFSPTHRAKASRDRRNLVLQSMVEAGYISQGEADAAKAKPLGLNLDDQRGKNDRSPYAYFVEEVRQELQRIMVEKHATDAMDVYRKGLSVYTTLNSEAQRQAVDAARKGARMYMKRHGWRVEFDNIFEPKSETEGEPRVVRIEEYAHPSWIAIPDVGDTLTGLIRDVGDAGTVVLFGNYTATITSENTEALDKSPAKLFKRGDLAQFKIEAVDQARKQLKVTLEPEPEVQTALVVLDATTGEIKAMVGGYNFATSKFNHATQANRQTGSAFKPFIYAAAIEQGLKPDDIVDDSPFKRGDWSPHNYDDTFQGAMPIRKAFALSRNIPAVRVLDEIGVRNAADLVKRMGLPNPMAPFLPSALGATEEPLLSMVSAYSAFPNHGVRIEPIRILRVVDRYGAVLDQTEPKQYKVLSDYVAAQMVDMMRGVVQSGTAVAASAIGHEVAGKTGTVNDFTDAWFIGYTAKYTCGVWIGYSDQKKSLGKSESGSSAALPFWVDFMQKFMKNKPKEKFGRVPDLPEDLKQIQVVRSREHAQELARIAARTGDVLPDSKDLPNLDPLAGVEPPPSDPVTPVSSRPNPPPAETREREAPRADPPPRVVRAPEPTPRPKPEEPSRKGKKGKVSDDPPR
ncbi:MAG: PBP1A family penicillin-binding protein [Blastocatellia bacterium]|nr:PBP1A family penicillin-binding protein [Blastocatellia bacterium]